MTKLAIFNLDNTLCDFARSQARAQARIALILREAQIPEEPFWSSFAEIEPEIQNAMVGGFLDSSTYLWRAFFETCSRFTSCVGVLPDALTRIFKEETIQKTKLFDDAEETLGALQEAGIQIAVYARGDSTSQREKFHNLGLHKIVGAQALFISEELCAPSSSQGDFSHILSIVNAPKEDTVVISDVVDSEFAMAKSAGIRTILVKRNTSANVLHDEEHLGSLRELLAALNATSAMNSDYPQESSDMIPPSHIISHSEIPWRKMYWE